MNDEGPKRGSVVWATLDFLMAVFGMGIVLLPALLVADTGRSSPLGDVNILLVAGVLGVGCAYPFVTGDWSLGRLGDYIFAFTVCVLCIGFIVVLGAILFGFSIRSGRATQALSIGGAYVLAYLFVFTDRIDTPSRSGQP